MGDIVPPMAISLVLSAIVLVGFIASVRRGITVTEFLVPMSVAIVLVWPFWSFRFVLPLTPYLYLYLITGIQALTRSMRAARIVVLCLIGLALYDHAFYIWHVRSGSEGHRMEWVDRAGDVDRALEWIRDHLPAEGTVASTNPALLYLRTGRKSFTYDDPTRDVSLWKARGFQYMVCLRPLDLPGVPGVGYRVLYSAAQLWVIEL
jgi:hypothetical protein